MLFMGNGCSQSDPNDEQNIVGYSFLTRIPGLWSGPVSTSTTAGNINNWYVDFRPVSPGQVAQYSYLYDSTMLENISFFIVKYNNRLHVAMRTEGCARDTCCATYEVLDSVVETEGLYRFTDFVRGKSRACTFFKFTGDALTMTTYTNKFNESDTLVWHSTWSASLATKNYANEAIAHFNYPQPEMTADFSGSFTNMNESIFYNLVNDPYSPLTQPYVGSVNINISVAQNLGVTESDNILILLTTESLFEGILFNPEKMKYTSKYVFVSPETKKITMINIHPGTYYLYTLIDKNHDGTYLSGDYMSSNINNTFTVPENGSPGVNTVIDFVIP